VSEASASGVGEAPAQTGIRVAGLRHVYKGGTVALDGVDLEIGRGLFGLLGPNGAGKSTLMRILCTLIKPSAGQAWVGGHDVLKDGGKVRKSIGYLPQEFGGWRLQRVGEALDTLAMLSGMRDSKERERRVDSTLESVGLGDVSGRKIKALSGGMVRRLGVAQALIHDPSVLIVDEPTVGLDPAERLRFRGLMASLAADRTILLSTHIVADLGEGCRDLALIDKGKVVYRGSPDALVERAKGKVFEMTIAVDGAERLPTGVEIVSQRPDGVGMRIRAVCGSGKPPAEGTPVDDPTLEEGYLVFMAARGRAVADIAGEDA
jgi:ABC-type multidrug transport system ATPase subunit